MLSWLDRLIGGRPDAADSLAQRLRSYPAYAAPHAGPPSRWSPEHAQANLDYLLQHRAERLQLLSALLAQYGIDTAPALTGADPVPLVDALHRWANETWASVHERRLASREAWLASTRQGAEIVYSLLMDVAILLGELIVRRRPSFAWAIDRDETNRDDGMTSYNRPVLIAFRVGSGTQIELDVEEVVAMRYIQLGSPGVTLLNTWKQLVMDAVSGAYERPI